MNDFRKYATKHLGINGMMLDDVIKSQAQYLNPYILEERQLNVTQMDVFSRLMMDRIIFLGTQIDDYTANVIQAQLLYLDSSDPGKDISIYIRNSHNTKDQTKDQPILHNRNNDNTKDYTIPNVPTNKLHSPNDRRTRDHTNHNNHQNGSFYGNTHNHPHNYKSHPNK